MPSRTSTVRECGISTTMPLPRDFCAIPVKHPAEEVVTAGNAQGLARAAEQTATAVQATAQETYAQNEHAPAELTHARIRAVATDMIAAKVGFRADGFAVKMDAKREVGVPIEGHSPRERESSFRTG